MKYDGYNLAAVLQEHKKYIDSYYSNDPKAPEPNENWKADFRGCIIRKVDFANVIRKLDLAKKLLCIGNLPFDLRHANFQGAIIDQCNFGGFDLSYSDFGSAVIQQSSFSGCDLSNSDFAYARIMVSNFHGAKLPHINARFMMLNNALFTETDLSHSDMVGAMIHSCRFRGANLDGAYLEGATLYNEDNSFENVNVTDETKMPFVPMKCPSEGSFIGWKVGFAENEKGQCVYALIKLEIPKRAKRTGYLSNKCRCSEAKVLDITEVYHPRKHYKQAVSYVRRDYVYTVGRIARPEQTFNDNKWVTCASGIHFFTSKEEAINYIG